MESLGTNDPDPELVHRPLEEPPVILPFSIKDVSAKHIMVSFPALTIGAGEMVTDIVSLLLPKMRSFWRPWEVEISVWRP